MHAYVSLCALHAYMCPQKASTVHCIHWIWSYGWFWPILYDLLELNSEDLEEQQVFGITKSSL